jgi:uracil-DNA glycosylase
MSMKLERTWHEQLKEEISLPYVQELKQFLSQEKSSGQIIYPPEPNVFQAFSYTPFAKVKVVIVGQDPYHGPNQAHGLSFSVSKGIPFPPSLKNIFKELVEDVGISYPKTGCLIPWAEQGVLLLNATLTVRAGQPRSHYGKGWERFTDSVIQKLLQRDDPVVFILWGKSAQEKCQHILQAGHTHHAMLLSAHPSPYSATGFFGCKHFSKANEYLKKWGKTPIDWAIE